MEQGAQSTERIADHQFLSVKELAAILNVSVRWVHERTRRREIPCYRFGNLLRFDLEEVLTWMRREQAS